ncbi:hypothetical protein DO021_20655 [Desulfobacter hydrogenophilus]|uniref:Uncharacterized protein n=1 Tax=Desulfobacter hydrogenophilus TaxID=2291 RepID=A0A328F9S0_9BACT|nr:hypothetical protein [Desulfobacter hydrogenophilus]NDY74297.1 hypothetical protein [Desulfobacter hydrogenophilus]QBH12305.1 hypothetical protein EYB58_04860 [Desulfobacter hydrogenophilus]RAM00142.1 hypothetical protein DO021_20655 [Desulfobacter hydrogenophilus]
METVEKVMNNHAIKYSFMPGFKQIVAGKGPSTQPNVISIRFASERCKEYRQHLLLGLTQRGMAGFFSFFAKNNTAEYDFLDKQTIPSIVMLYSMIINGMDQNDEPQFVAHLNGGSDFYLRTKKVIRVNYEPI